LRFKRGRGEGGKGKKERDFSRRTPIDRRDKTKGKGGKRKRKKGVPRYYPGLRRKRKDRERDRVGLAGPLASSRRNAFQEKKERGREGKIESRDRIIEKRRPEKKGRPFAKKGRGNTVLSASIVVPSYILRELR